MYRLQQASIEQRTCHIADDIANGLPRKDLWRSGGIAELEFGQTIRRFRREEGCRFDGSCREEVLRPLLQPILLDRVANGPLAELAQIGDGKGAGRVGVSLREGEWPATVGWDSPASEGGGTRGTLIPQERVHLTVWKRPGAFRQHPGRASFVRASRRGAGLGVGAGSYE